MKQFILLLFFLSLVLGGVANATIWSCKSQDFGFFSSKYRNVKIYFDKENIIWKGPNRRNGIGPDITIEFQNIRFNHFLFTGSTVVEGIRFEILINKMDYKFLGNQTVAVTKITKLDIGNKYQSSLYQDCKDITFKDFNDPPDFIQKLFFY